MGFIINCLNNLRKLIDLLINWDCKLSIIKPLSLIVMNMGKAVQDIFTTVVDSAIKIHTYPLKIVEDKKVTLSIRSRLHKATLNNLEPLPSSQSFIFGSRDSKRKNNSKRKHSGFKS